MFRALLARIGHHALLLAVTAGLYLPGLGGPSLWDVDEGHNVECGREMLESGNWVTPTFNYQLRVDKPALLYWLQLLAAQVFGVGEFAGRLPSALASAAAVLATYELGRKLFDPGAALLGGLVLASSLLFTGSAHFANPDALLNAWTVLIMLFFWLGFSRNEPDWWIVAGLCSGFGFLTKGPVALVLPSAVATVFLLWTGRLRRLLTTRILLAGLVFAVVGLPWFALVGSETKGEYLRGFFLVHNRDRFLSPMEGHGGGFYYHVLSLAVGFAPWSAFFGPVVMSAWGLLRGRLRQREAAPGVKFLICWFGVYFVFFSVSGTKLPNYILPLYPAVALLTGWSLEGWRRGDFLPAGWVMPAVLMVWTLVGLVATVGLLVVGGAIPIPGITTFPGLELGCFLGAFPVLGAAVAWVCLRRGARNGLVGSLAVTAVLFVGGLVGWGTAATERFKAPRALVDAAEARQVDREVRVGCFDYYQPSLVFYCEREVNRLGNEREAADFLACPLPVYLFLTASAWETLQAKVSIPCRQLARHYDFYSNCDVVVVTNR
jgi:4-amino-4-deoxy-L-arabinose transferase-like glycosyltransferase